MRLDENKFLRIWSNGLKNTVKFFLVIGIGGILFCSAWVIAKPSYRSVLKKWTRHDKVYVLDNLEARMIWHVTYLSDEFREARRQKMAELYQETDEEQQKCLQEDLSESKKYDVFFVGIYAGSSQFPEIGKNSGGWRLFLQTGSEEPVESVAFEKIPVTQVERMLYPYLDKWSKTYVVKFPKTISDGDSFSLTMPGIPAKSTLTWMPK